MGVFEGVDLIFEDDFKFLSDSMIELLVQECGSLLLYKFYDGDYMLVDWFWA